MVQIIVTNEKSIAEAKAKLKNFLQDTIKVFDDEACLHFCRFTSRIKDLGSIDAVVEESMQMILDTGDLSHEFRVNNADLKIVLRIKNDGTLRGTVKNEYVSTETAKSRIFNMLLKNDMLA